MQYEEKFLEILMRIMNPEHVNVWTLLEVPRLVRSTRP